MQLEDEQKKRLADIESQSRARAFQQNLLSNKTPVAWVAPLLSIIVTLGFFIILVIFIFYKHQLEQTTASIPAGLDAKALSPEQLRAFATPTSDFVIQIINISVGALAAAFATVMSFWLGSSQSSRSKDELVATLQTQQSTQATQFLEKAAAVVAGERPRPAEGTSETPGPSGGPGPGRVGPADAAKPAPPGLLAEIIPELVKPHGHFDKGVQWALTPRGISVDGAAAMGTPGEPSTIRKIWRNFGDQCAASANRYGVPVELIVATIATESSGEPSARRAEPKINDESVGLMQTLVGTAREATGRTTLRGDDLLDPSISIDAGTAYIAKQRAVTHFDPPLVAAAYNAGSIRLDDQDQNRWKLRCFPIGTGAHIDRFVAWFADSMRVSAADGWARTKPMPSFVTAVGPVADKAGPDFPPPPPFQPLLTTEEKQQLFGNFAFRRQPLPNNPENIEITDGWDTQNIELVRIQFQGECLGRTILEMPFHKKVSHQLIGVWLDWEKAGLLDRVKTFDGAFVPRFMRGSTTSLSNHAFGTAFDINARFNPLNAEPALVGEDGSVRELVAIANKWGFYWGGHFKSRPDGMHFEIAEIKPV